jgi:hypothetical protein
MDESQGTWTMLETRINANILFYEVLYRQIIFGKLGMKTTELHNLYKVLNFPKRYFNTVDQWCPTFF